MCAPAGDASLGPALRALSRCADIVVVADDRRPGVAAAAARFGARLVDSPAELAGYDVVLVQDATRPVVCPAVVADLVRAVRAGAPAAVPLLIVPDTVKRVDPEGRIMSTVDRDTLRSVQNPYAIAGALLPRVWCAPDGVFGLGVPVTAVDGDPDARERV